MICNLETEPKTHKGTEYAVLKKTARCRLLPVRHTGFIPAQPDPLHPLFHYGRSRNRIDRNSMLRCFVHGGDGCSSRWQAAVVAEFQRDCGK